jgi:hypothetical protein
MPLTPIEADITADNKTHMPSTHCQHTAPLANTPGPCITNHCRTPPPSCPCCPPPVPSPSLRILFSRQVGSEQPACMLLHYAIRPNPVVTPAVVAPGISVAPGTATTWPPLLNTPTGILGVCWRVEVHRFPLRPAQQALWGSMTVPGWVTTNQAGGMQCCTAL